MLGDLASRDLRTSGILGVRPGPVLASYTMSFESRTLSNSTLARGLELVHACSHSMLHDPELETMQKELKARLFCWACVCEDYMHAWHCLASFCCFRL